MRGAPLLLAGVALLACESPPPAIDAAAADGGTNDAAGLDASTRDASGRSEAAIDGAVRGYGAAVGLGRVPSVLPETSGIVVSRAHPGVFWLENDSGNPADLFAVDERGALLATITVTGATNVDWEDLAIGSGVTGDELYVADTGDNAARTSGGTTGRSEIRLYRLAEPDPALGDQSLSAEAITLRYPSTPHDCEAVFVDAPTGDVYLVTKEDAPPARIFVARAPLDAGASLVLEDVGSFDLALVTAADQTRDGARVAVRNYGVVRVYDVLGGEVAASLASPRALTAPTGSPAEAIAFASDGRDLYTIAEGVGATLFRLPQL